MLTCHLWFLAMDDIFIKYFKILLNCIQCFQLGLSFNMKYAHLFIDRNGWPVMTNQEKELCVMDLLNNNASVLVCQHTAEKHTVCLKDVDSTNSVGKLR